VVVAAVPITRVVAVPEACSPERRRWLRVSNSWSQLVAAEPRGREPTRSPFEVVTEEIAHCACARAEVTRILRLLSVVAVVAQDEGPSTPVPVVDQVAVVRVKTPIPSRPQEGLAFKDKGTPEGLAQWEAMVVVVEAAVPALLAYQVAPRPAVKVVTDCRRT